MSTSSPSDLAVAFRSLPRRLDSASEDAPAGAIATGRAGVDSAVAAAARLLGSASTADAVGAAIAARRPEDWSDGDVQQLQSCADDAAKAIRTLSAAAGQDD